jgi:hypothetical protein
MDAERNEEMTVTELIERLQHLVATEDGAGDLHVMTGTADSIGIAGTPCTIDIKLKMPREDITLGQSRIMYLGPLDTERGLPRYAEMRVDPGFIHFCMTQRIRELENKVRRATYR